MSERISGETYALHLTEVARAFFPDPLSGDSDACRFFPATPPLDKDRPLGTSSASNIRLHFAFLALQWSQAALGRPVSVILQVTGSFRQPSHGLATMRTSTGGLPAATVAASLGLEESPGTEEDPGTTRRLGPAVALAGGRKGALARLVGGVAIEDWP